MVTHDAVAAEHTWRRAQGLHSSGVEAEFLGLATRSHARYGDGVRLEDMIKEDLIAERIAVATYSEIARWPGNDDPTTRRMIEELLATEEEHADDMAKLLSRVSK